MAYWQFFLSKSADQFQGFKVFKVNELEGLSPFSAVESESGSVRNSVQFAIDQE